MFPVALAFCAGAAALSALPALLPPAALWLPACAVALAIRRHPALAAFGAGLIWTQILASHWLAAGWPCTRDREELELTGRVAAPAIARNGRTDFDLEVLGSAAPGPLPARVRLSWYESARSIEPGQCWRMTVRLRCRRGMVNSGAADRELDLLRQRIDATGYVVDKIPPELVGRSAQYPIERMRSRVAGAIAAAVPAGPSVAVLQGLAVGARGSIPDDLWNTFAITGVAHLMAISGLHVTGCGLFVLLLVRLAWRLPGLAPVRARLSIEIGVVIAVTTAYALLAGASLPALRTLAMVGIVAALRLLRRILPVHGMLALAAVTLVAMDPLALTAGGFWLSFAATAALVSILIRGRGWRARVAGFARAQAAIGALLAPILIATFGRVSFVAPVVNGVAIPCFSLLLLPAVLAATALEIASPGTAAVIWRTLALALDAVWPWLSRIAEWSPASWAPASQPPLLILGAGLATVAALLLPFSGPRLAALATLATLLFGNASRPPAGGWTLSVVDVGQGLAAVVETANHVLVFDTGASWRGGGTAARVSLLPFLRSRGIRRVDMLVVSHDDMDHAGGVEELLRSVKVTRIVAGSGSTVSAAHVECVRGDSWHWDRIEFRMLHPPAGLPGSDNDRSCALSVAGAGGKALLLADQESAAEAMLVSMPLVADVVLLPHHGSRSSSTPELVAAVSARLGIASAGFGNLWGMPNAEIVARWRRAGTTVINTARSGAVTVRFAAGARAFEVATARGSAPRWWRSDWPDRRFRAVSAPARYHSAPCGKSSSPVVRSCGRSSCVRLSRLPSCSNECGHCSASA